MQSPITTCTAHPIDHKQWGNGCHAYTLLNTEELSIKQEAMPAGTEEQLHYHQKAQQFFYILKGTAVFEVNEVIIMLHEQESIHIAAGKHHKIMNKHSIDLEFLVCSQPSTENDRFNLV